MLEIELLQVAVGNRNTLSRIPTEEEWDMLFKFGKDQTIAGVLFNAFNYLPQEQKPDVDRLGKWYLLTQYLNSENEKMDIWCTKVSKRFLRYGFDCWILKGQGLNKLYKNDSGWNEGSFFSNTHFIRTAGDIDIWVVPKMEPLPSLDKRREIIYNFCTEHIPGYTDDEEGQKHTSFNVDDILVEVHCTPHYLRPPKQNKMMQEWFLEELKKDKQDKKAIVLGKSFPTPSLEFNLIFLMLHLHGHYMFEGVGLRQIIDYYIVLQKMMQEDEKEITRLREYTMEKLTAFGVDKFAAGVMWVLKEVFVPQESNTKTEWMLCPPDEWRGKMLLQTILEGGNFGKKSKLNSQEYYEVGIKRIVRYFKQKGQLLRAYPNDIIWHTLRRIWETLSRQPVDV